MLRMSKIGLHLVKCRNSDYLIFHFNDSFTNLSYLFVCTCVLAMNFCVHITKIN